MNELQTSELVWLILGQLGLILVMIGGVWIGATNHDKGRLALPAPTIWLIWVQCVAAAFLFTHPFKTEIIPSLPPIGHGFRLAVGVGFVAYPITRRFGRTIRMSRKVESGFTYLVALIALAAVGLAGFYGFRHYSASDNGYLTAQAKRNAKMLQADTALTYRLNHKVDSLTRLTHSQAGEVATLTDEVRGLNRQVQESNGLITALLRKLTALQGMITRLLGKPSLPVQQTGYAPKPEAVLDPRRVQSLPPAMHEKTN